jgi:hypothetical protein
VYEVFGCGVVIRVQPDASLSISERRLCSAEVKVRRASIPCSGTAHALRNSTQPEAVVVETKHLIGKVTVSRRIFGVQDQSVIDITARQVVLPETAVGERPVGQCNVITADENGGDVWCGCSHVQNKGMRTKD